MKSTDGIRELASQYFGKSISRKLYLLLFVVGLLPMTAVAFSVYRSAYDGIASKSLDQLEAIKTVKSNQVRNYFELIQHQIQTFAENRMIVEAMQLLPEAQRNARAEAGVDAQDLARMQEDLQGYYVNDFSSSFREQNAGVNPRSNQQLEMLDKDSIYLQTQYLSSNPNPLGEKEKLDAAQDGTSYSVLHAKYHPVVRSYLQRFGYRDIFLCDIESGDIVYSVGKKPDFTTSLSAGPYAETNFGKAFRLAANADSPVEVYLVDYDHYVPSFGEPASFVASPIFDGKKKIGVAVFQIPLDRIAAIMGERTGLGLTGETYAVGPDLLMRSGSRSEPNAILSKKIDTGATRSAFQGKVGKSIIDDVRGVSVLSSWSPVTIYAGIPGKAEAIRWALVSEIEQAEIASPLNFWNIARNGIFWIFAACCVGVYFARIVAGRITEQAESIKDMLGNVGIGVFDARAQKITEDELGEVAVSLNAMCDNTLALIQSDEERQSIQNSIESLIHEMEQIASGNLVVEAEVRDDVTGAIATTVNHMTEQLRTIVQQVQNGTHLVTTSAEEIAKASSQLSAANERQAERIAETSGQVIEMTNQFQEVAETTQASMEVAQKAKETASRGYEAVSDTVHGMQRIREQVQSTSKRIKRLGESSQEIGEIVQLISDIADRTSILALNASIQAAMAGDAGQGFAVVAEEVERLAERSTDATKQIASLIKTIQTETSEAITDMEESTREVVEGSHLATQAGQTLSEINEVSHSLEALVESVSTSARQQAGSAAQIADSMQEISDATLESAAQSRSATEDVNALAQLANKLGESVSQFSLEPVAQASEDESEQSSTVVTPQFDTAFISSAGSNV